MLIFLSLKKSLNFFFLLLALVMFFFCLYLYFNNKKLKERISKLEIETKEILERKLTKELASDLIKIDKISSSKEKKEDIEEQEVQLSQEKTTIPQLSVIAKNQEALPTNKKNNKDISILYQSPNIERTITEIDMNELINHPDIDRPFSFSEFIQKDTKTVPEIKTRESNINYLEELSNRIEAEMKPQTIELTDYEKVQEEQAVISYQELLSLKNKFETQSEVDENSLFIDELKNFRNNLN